MSLEAEYASEAEKGRKQVQIILDVWAILRLFPSDLLKKTDQSKKLKMHNLRVNALPSAAQEFDDTIGAVPTQHDAPALWVLWTIVSQEFAKLLVEPDAEPPKPFTDPRSTILSDTACRVLQQFDQLLTAARKDDCGNGLKTLADWLSQQFLGDQMDDVPYGNIEHPPVDVIATG